jgi:hypothetical protein
LARVLVAVPGESDVVERLTQDVKIGMAVQARIAEGLVEFTPA